VALQGPRQRPGRRERGREEKVLVLPRKPETHYTHSTQLGPRTEGCRGAMRRQLQEEVCNYMLMTVLIDLMNDLSKHLSRSSNIKRTRVVKSTYFDVTAWTRYLSSLSLSFFICKIGIFTAKMFEMIKW
jgi:hypothetical protein